MTTKKRTEELREAELDTVTGGITIDPGAVLKLQDANIDAGSAQQMQVTSFDEVVFYARKDS